MSKCKSHDCCENDEFEVINATFEPPPYSNLFLKQCGNSVAVVLHDNCGNEVATLATFSQYGIRREHDIPVYLGLPLDADGRVMLDET